ncbi:MAG: PP2C family protein-serine/threonine phosphatase [Hydrogenovibrio sp.]
MHYRNRVLLFVTGVVLVSVVSVSLVVGWQARQTVLEEAERYGELIAQLLSRSASAADEVPYKVEAMIGEQMVAQARLVAEWIVDAERAQQSPEEINARLKQLADTTVIDEIWVTDSFGESIYHSENVSGFVFHPDAEEQPQAYAFWPLLTGRTHPVIQQAQPREIDQQVFKYVGVGGADQPRIVEIGLRADFLTALKQQIGLDYMVKKLIGQGNIKAIWVLSSDLKTLASGHVKGTQDAMVLDADTLNWLEQVYHSGHTQTRLQNQRLVVATPLKNAVSGLEGVTLLHLPVNVLHEAERDLYDNVAWITLAILVLSLSSATLLSRRVTRPLKVMNEAVEKISRGQYAQVDMGGLTKRQDEFGSLSRVFQDMAKTVGQREAWLDEQVRQRTLLLEEKNQALAKFNDRMTQELDVARTFQKAILPTRFPDFSGQLVFSADMEPAREMGGDFYDVFALSHRQVMMVVADVSDKGVPAAFFMAICRTEIRNATVEMGADACPAEILSRVNQRLLSENPLELFVTVFLAILDVETGEMRYANGGHNPPLHLQASDRTDWLTEAKGTVLGMLEGLRWTPQTLCLQPGEGLIFYTDGITEAFNAEMEAFGEARFAALADALRRGPADAMAQTVLEAVSDFIGTAPVSDDRTLLCVKYQGERYEGERHGGERHALS